MNGKTSAKTSPKTLHLLSAGAAQGLVQALQERFQAATGAVLRVRFGAVGAMKEALLSGAPCDVLIVSAAMVDALCAAGSLRAGTQAALGGVRTGIAVPALAGGPALPDVSSAAALRAALLGADRVYFPDPERATAGIHFARVLRELGIFETLQPRLSTHPNGATAMRAMADAAGGGTAHPSAPRLIGCTQVSEIICTPGVHLAGELPPPFGLETVYAGAIASGAAEMPLAADFIALLAGSQTLALRAACGFVA